MGQATQGQHLRMQIGTTSANKGFCAFSTDLSFHVSSTLEDSTTKDTTDTTGLWLEQEKTKHNIDGSITAILDEGEAQGFTEKAQAGELFWELDWVNGEQNRVIVTKICAGTTMLMQNVEISAPRDGFCQLTGSFVIFGAIDLT